MHFLSYRSKTCFPDACNIPKEERGPASPILVIAFMLSCAGSYAGSTLANYIFAIQAWHILHGLSWGMDDLQVKATLMDTTVLTPLASDDMPRMQQRSMEPEI